MFLKECLVGIFSFRLEVFVFSILMVSRVLLFCYSRVMLLFW